MKKIPVILIASLSIFCFFWLRSSNDKFNDLAKDEILKQEISFGLGTYITNNLKYPDNYDEFRSYCKTNYSNLLNDKWNVSFIHEYDRMLVCIQPFSYESLSPRNKSNPSDYTSLDLIANRKLIIDTISKIDIPCDINLSSPFFKIYSNATINEKSIKDSIFRIVKESYQNVSNEYFLYKTDVLTPKMYYSIHRFNDTFIIKTKCSNLPSQITHDEIVSDMTYQINHLEEVRKIDSVIFSSIWILSKAELQNMSPPSPE